MLKIQKVEFIHLLIFTLLVTLIAQSQAFQCDSSCVECFGSLPIQCTKCAPGFALTNYQCLSSCPATSPFLSADDQICRSSEYDTDHPCLPGTYNQFTGAQSNQSCTQCDTGHYCQYGGQGATSGQCAAGYYCYSQSSFKMPMAVYSTQVSYFNATFGDYCKAGSFCPAGSTLPQPCDAGHYCPSILMTQRGNVCNPGFYCSGGASTSTPLDGVTGNECPPGYYCPSGSNGPSPCPIGTYLFSSGGSDSSNCTTCPPGQYCDRVGANQSTGSCVNGYYCPGGVQSAMPVSYQCPIGFYCPTGAMQPLKCPAGQYSFEKGSITCTNCPAGYYCSALNYAQQCDPGYYCPGSDVKVPCPAGFFSTNYGASLISTCQSCLAGYSCQLPGTGAPSTQCSAGYYCSAGATTPYPNSQSLQGGGMCTPGTYCQTGSSAAQACPAGKYCKDYASKQVTNDCEAGYYCLPGSKVSNPVLCPPGSFCPQGSTLPSSCPVGYYTSSLGSASVSDCQPCPSGLACDGQGLVNPNINCTAGYYCPSGSSSSTPTAYMCQPGYKCPQGSKFATPCQAGSYQPQSGQSVCLACPAGQYCDGSNPSNSSACLPGYYCPLGTSFSSQYPCPAGTYNSKLGLSVVSQCTPCPLGYYCQYSGQLGYTTQILAGYFSIYTGNTGPAPSVCIIDHYCPLGTGMPIPCPNGQISPWTGSMAIGDCVPCLRGYFCNLFSYYSTLAYSDTNANYISDAHNNPSLYGMCSAGYICKEGSSTNKPTDGLQGYICPVGYYCLAGDIIERPCRVGSYNNQTGQSQCLTCPAGAYCNKEGMINYQVCTQGNYCPAGSIRALPCPAGTLSNGAGLTSASQCTPCPAGKYCATHGLAIPTGNCSAGFVCSGGSNTSTPYVKQFDFSLNNSGTCPPGYYCPIGTISPIACPQGQYVQFGGSDRCYSCPAGTYCPGAGTIQPFECWQGYYCQIGTIEPFLQLSSQYSLSNGFCKSPYYCPTGTPIPLTCRDGLYNNQDGQYQCSNCTNGYTCSHNVQTICPQKKFCASGYDHPYGQYCLNGTYSLATTGMSSANQCTQCPIGQYCVASAIAGNCASGYICLQGAGSPTPQNGTGKAYPCPLGAYCAQGVFSPSICPIGTFTFQVGAMQQDQCVMCQAGFYCQYNVITPTVCPEGNYCPLGSELPTPCPVAFYNPYVGGQSIADCIDCKGGYFCNETGIGFLQDYLLEYRCPNGYFCPQGTQVPFPCKAGTFSDLSLRYGPQSMTDCQQCPQHYYCPLATTYRYSNPCPSGTFCNQGSSYPQLCPSGSYCIQTSAGGGQYQISMQQCPSGYYCPLGTSNPIKCNITKGESCPAGSYYPTYQLINKNMCGPGYYYGYGQCNLCLPGYVCSNGTSTKYPYYISIDGGYECPTGYYCPKGSAVPTPCPAGTQRLSTKGTSLADCYQCPNGTYNNQTGQIACTICGRAATNSADSTSCQCVGLFRLWRQSDNQCVCKSGYMDPNMTQSQQTSVISLDCLPILKIPCNSDQHLDNNGLCISNDICKNASLCNGKGTSLGYYSTVASKCMCEGTNSDVNQYCDQNCQLNSLKAYFNKNGSICLQAGSLSMQCLNQSTFGSSLNFAGLKCQQTLCLMTSLNNINGAMAGSYEAAQVFIDQWQKIHPSYVSPYSQINQNSTSTNRLRLLQSINNQIDSAIVCIQPNNALSFQISSSHFPVYVRNSPYNSNLNFDAGLFDLLQSQLIGSNLNISTFIFTFTSSGVYVFGDYQNIDAVQTIVKVSGSCSNTTNIYPLTEQNLELLGITAHQESLQSLPQSVIVIPIIMILLTFVSTGIQSIIENRIIQKETEKRLNRAGKKRNYQKDNGKLDKKQYLNDLYKLIKDNLEEVKETLAGQQDKGKLLKLLKDKNNLLNELGGSGKQQIDDLKQQVRSLLDQMRFPDGKSLQDRLKDWELEREIDRKLMPNVELEQLSLHDEDEEQDSDIDDDDKINLLKQMNYNHDQDNDNQSDNENEEDDDEDDNGSQKNQNGDDNDMELMIQLKKEQKNQKQNFMDRINDLVEDEESRDAMVDGFDNKIKLLQNQLQNEAKKQEDLLAKRLAARKMKNKNLMRQVSRKFDEKEEKIEQLDEERYNLQEQLDDMIENGAKDDKLQEKMKRDKDLALTQLDKIKDQKVADVREEYMNRLKLAKNDKEKEQILEEMARRLKSIEDELNKERKDQEKNLDKLLKQRLNKRLKKQQKEQEQLIKAKEEDIANLQQDIALDKVRLYAEEGGIDGLVDSRLKDKCLKLVDKVINIEDSGEMYQLGEGGKDQLEVLKVQQELEKERIIRALDIEIEEQMENQREKLKEESDKKIQAERDSFNKRISQATNENDRKRLIQELKDREFKMGDEMENERLRQERTLEERKQSRLNKKKIKEMELDAQQMNDLQKKELELKQKKFNQEIESFNEKLETEVSTMLKQIEKRPDQQEQALMAVQETADEALKRKMKMLINKQFFELGKYLAGLYTDLAMKQMVEKEKINDKYQNLEDDAYLQLQGEKLRNKLQQIRNDKENEQAQFEEQFATKEKEQEAELREQLEERFCKEKKDFIEQDMRSRSQHIQNIIEKNKGKNPQMDAVAKQLIQTNQNNMEEQMNEFDQQKNENIEKIKLQIVAENEAEVEQMQKKIDEQLDKEKDDMERRMKQKRDEIMGDKKKHLEERMQEMSGQLSSIYREQIIKQYEEELSRLEKAIIEERDKQLTKMRQNLIKKRIERERQRKEEQSKQALTQRQTDQKANNSKLNTSNDSKMQVMSPERSKIMISSPYGKSMNSSMGKNIQQFDTKDKLRQLLNEWNQKIETVKHTQAIDQQNVWEKESQTSSVKSMKSNAMGVGLNKLNTSVVGNQQKKNEVQAYTMEELLKKIKRVEKLTQLMDQDIRVNNNSQNKGKNVQYQKASTKLAGVLKNL